MVQSILSSMDGAEVNSISDDVEATQVASIIRDNYNWIINKSKLPEHYSLFELTASGDTTIPTVMYLPNHVGEVQWIKYDNQVTGDDSSSFKPVPFRELNLFMDTMHSLDSTGDNIVDGDLTISGQGTFGIKCYNDRMPAFFTTFNDHTLIFDAYDASEESTLTGNRTECYGLIYPSFTLSDSFTPNLDDDMFALLILESKTQAFEEMKQMVSRNAERKARSAWITTSVNKQAVRTDSWYNNLPDYGRKQKTSTIRFK